jgi:hypothetical protein
VIHLFRERAYQQSHQSVAGAEQQLVERIKMAVLVAALGIQM